MFDFFETNNNNSNNNVDENNLSSTGHIEDELLLNEIKEIYYYNELMDFAEKIVNLDLKNSILNNSVLCDKLLERIVECKNNLGIYIGDKIEPIQDFFYYMGQDFSKSFFINMLNSSSIDKNLIIDAIIECEEFVPALLSDESCLKLINSNNIKDYKPLLLFYCSKFGENMPPMICNKIQELLNSKSNHLTINDKAIFEASLLGLKIQSLSPEKAKEISDEEDENIKYKYQNSSYSYTTQPTLEQIMLVRRTKVFPLNNQITTATNSNAMIGCSLGEYFEDLFQAELIEKCKEYARNNNVEGVSNFGDAYSVFHSSPEKMTEIYQMYNTLVKQYSIKSKMYRDTIHFTTNCLVTPNDGGNWDDLPFIILEPLSEHIGVGDDKNPDNFENLAGFDTWTKDKNFALKKPTILIISNQILNVLNLAKQDERVMNTLKNAEIVIMDINENTTATHYTRAILSQKGCPSYYCSNSYIRVLKSRLDVDPGINLTLQDLASELNIKYGTLHSNHESSNIETAKLRITFYDSCYKFYKYVSKKLNLELKEDFTFKDKNLDIIEEGKAKRRLIKQIEIYLSEQLKKANIDSTTIKEWIDNFNKFFINNVNTNPNLEKSVVFSIEPNSNEDESTETQKTSNNTETTSSINNTTNGEEEGNGFSL